MAASSTEQPDTPVEEGASASPADAVSGGWASWAPSGRSAVPLIVLLVISANLVGVATVTLLLVGVNDGSG